MIGARINDASDSTDNCRVPQIGYGADVGVEQRFPFGLPWVTGKVNDGISTVDQTRQRRRVSEIGNVHGLVGRSGFDRYSIGQPQFATQRCQMRADLPRHFAAGAGEEDAIERHTGLSGRGLETRAQGVGGTREQRHVRSNGHELAAEIEVARDALAKPRTPCGR